MRTLKYERFYNGDEPSLFQADPPPQYEQISLPMQSQEFSSTTNVFQPVKSPAPPDYILWSVFNSLCCICPIGLCAICASINVRNKAGDGDIEGARSSSRCALGLNIFNNFLGTAVLTFIILVYTDVHK